MGVNADGALLEAAAEALAGANSRGLPDGLPDGSPDGLPGGGNSGEVRGSRRRNAALVGSGALDGALRALPLFAALVRSLYATREAGFSYTVYVAANEGDPLLGDDARVTFLRDLSFFF